MPLTSEQLATLDGDSQTATLIIWGPVTAPSPANLRIQVRQAVKALNHPETDRVDLILQDGTKLRPDEIRQLHSRFTAE